MSVFSLELFVLLEKAFSMKRVGQLCRHQFYLLLVIETNFLLPNAKIWQRLWHVKNNTKEIPVCKMCSSPVTWRPQLKSYSTYCSSKCIYKDEEIVSKRNQTNIKRFGSPSPFGNEQVIKKKKETFLKNYGVDNSTKNIEIGQKAKNATILAHQVRGEEIRKKTKQTNLERWGVENPFQLEKIKEQIIKTNIKNYGVKSFKQAHLSSDTLEKTQNKEWLTYQHHVLKKSITRIAQELQIDATTLTQKIDKLSIDRLKFYFSQGEKEVLEFLKQYVENIQSNTRSLIPPFELDIYIPEKQIAVEYCGLYWHSDSVRPKDYHQTKYLKCKEKNIRLITIFEDEWINKQEIVKRKLLNILNLTQEQKVFARKCAIENVSTKQKQRFLEENHIQGKGAGSISYGLIYNYVLVALITFIKKRNEIYELNRYATSCHVIGGFGKLLNHFKNNHPWNEINTFADLRWHEGNLYEITGFEFMYTTGPIYEYVIGEQRLHRSLFMRRHLPKWLGTHFDPQLTEFQNMDRAGILRVWNCGLKKYHIKNNS